MTYSFGPYVVAEIAEDLGPGLDATLHGHWERVHLGLLSPLLEAFRQPWDLLVSPEVHQAQKRPGASAVPYRGPVLVRSYAPHLDVDLIPLDDQVVDRDVGPCQLDGQETAAPSSLPSNSVTDLGTQRQIDR